MDTLILKNCEKFAEKVAFAYEDAKNRDSLNSIDIVAKFYTAKELIKELILIGYDIASIEDLAEPDFNGYTNEYIISIWDDKIWGNKAKYEKGYINAESESCFILENCSSKILSHITAENKFEVVIEDFDESNDTDGVAEIIKDEDGNIVGVEITKYDDKGYSTYSYYSNTPLSDEELEEKLGFTFT